MGQENVAQPVAADFCGQRGSSIVAEVAVPAHDALFGGPGTDGVFLEEFGVVVGFEHQNIHFARSFHNEFGDMTEIGEHADANSICRPNGKSNRVVGIVGHAEGFNGEVSDFKEMAGGEQAPGNVGLRFVFRIAGDGFGREPVGENRDGTLFAQCGEAARVIGVLVGQ